MLPCSIVQQDTNDHEHGSNGRKASDFVPKNDNTEPDRKCVLHSAGDAETTQKSKVTIVLDMNASGFCGNKQNNVCVVCVSK